LTAARIAAVLVAGLGFGDAPERLICALCFLFAVSSSPGAKPAVTRAFGSDR
jgi:hypothetical protein